MPFTLTQAICNFIPVISIEENFLFSLVSITRACIIRDDITFSIIYSIVQAAFYADHLLIFIQKCLLNYFSLLGCSNRSSQSGCTQYCAKALIACKKCCEVKMNLQIRNLMSLSIDTYKKILQCTLNNNTYIYIPSLYYITVARKLCFPECLFK